MGGLISVFSSSENEGSSLDDSVSRPGLGDLPECCITSILTHLAPLEICKLAQLNRAFWGASSADNLWESKLPSNYMFLVERVLGEHAATGLTKKGIYAGLCRRNSFDGGSKEVWLDKVSGEVCLSISSKALKITGIDDRRYWNLISTEESRFNTVAYLKQIWWVELVGGIEFQFPPGNYSLYFRLQLGRTLKRFGRRICDLDRVHGWDMKPVQFQLSTSEGQEATSECYLHDPGNWVHYHAGDFVVENPNRPIMVRFSMVQIDCTHTKGGLCVDSVLICPSKQLKSKSRSHKFPLSI